MALLGASEPEIAREKAGIIKPGVPVVIGKADSEVREVFESTAAKLGAPIVLQAIVRISVLPCTRAMR